MVVPKDCFHHIYHSEHKNNQKKEILFYFEKTYRFHYVSTFVQIWLEVTIATIYIKHRFIYC